MAGLCRRRSGPIRKKYGKRSGDLALRDNVLPGGRQTAWQALSQENGAHFADEFVETAEKRYADLLAIEVIEMRLKR
jgi:hypothetical protein